MAGRTKSSASKGKAAKPVAKTKKDAPVLAKSVADKDYELWLLLRHARDSVAKARDYELDEVGLSRIQAGILYVVKTSTKPVTPAEISRWLLREPHTVKVDLDNMEKLGLITRVKDLPRRNLIRVSLTEKGEEAFNKSMEMPVIHRVMGSLSGAERENLRTLLDKLRNQALEEMHTLQAERRRSKTPWGPLSASR